MWKIYLQNVQISTQVEEDLVVEKSKIKQVSDDLNAVFDELMWLETLQDISAHFSIHLAPNQKLQDAM